MSLILALGRQRQRQVDFCEFRASLVCRVSLRATKKDPVSKNQKTDKQKNPKNKTKQQQQNQTNGMGWVWGKSLNISKRNIRGKLGLKSFNWVQMPSGTELRIFPVPLHLRLVLVHCKNRIATTFSPIQVRG